jgi:uncharacterized membrane protein YvlD (DUF360 family)
MQNKGWVIRLIIGLVLPVIVAALVMTITGALYERSLAVFEKLPMMITFGYFFMFIPSLIFTFMMEFLANRKLKQDWQVFVTGMVLGGLSSLIIWDGSLNDLNFSQVVGPIVGFICAWVLRRHYKAHGLSASA